MLKRGESVTLTAIEADLRRRDTRDIGRAEAPLRAAPDAVVLDNSDLGRAESVAEAIRLVEASGG